MSRRYIAKNPDLPFADALLVDEKTLYISGRIGFTPGTRELPADLDAEATYLMQDLKAILAAADMTLDDLVTLTIYCPDVSLWERFNGIYRQFLHRPASSARLHRPRARRCSSAPTSSCRAPPLKLLDPPIIRSVQQTSADGSSAVSNSVAAASRR